MRPSRLLPILLALIYGQSTSSFAADINVPMQAAAPHPRLIVLADMGNEPDEEQQMVHLLMYANEFEIEGLIAVTGKYLRNAPQPELFHQLIDGYDKVVENLRLHADFWPTAAQLRSVVSTGQSHYGIADTGPGKSSPGSRLVEAAITRENYRPLNIIVNAGSNTLAQALLDLESKLTSDKFAAALARIRVFENGAQDNAGAWIMHRWPSIHWIRSNYQTYAYGGPSVDGASNNSGDRNTLGPYTWAPYEYSGVGQHQWALQHLKGNHGRLMALWPIRQFPGGGVSFLEGGGTVPFLRLLDIGLYVGDQPSWGSWGGRYGTTRTKNVWSKHRDVRADEETYGDFFMFDELNDTWTDPESGTTYTDHNFAPVWRWRDAFFRDFAARADWCVVPFDQANHSPEIAGKYLWNEFRRSPFGSVSAAPGSTLDFDASSTTDPDGNPLTFAWWIYPEAGTYHGSTDSIITTRDEPKVQLKIPADIGTDTIHLILEVTDQPPTGQHPMSSFRRVVIKGH